MTIRFEMNEDFAYQLAAKRNLLVWILLRFCFVEINRV